MRRVKDGLTKAERYNRQWEKAYDFVNKVEQQEMKWLRKQGVSEEEIQNAKKHTGLGKDALYELIMKVARENGDNREYSEMYDEIMSISDGCGRKVKDENQIGWLKGKSNFVLHLKGKTGNVTSLKYEQTIPFESGYGDVYTKDVDGKGWLTFYMVYNNQLYREVASAKQVDWIKENGFSKWWVDNSISDSNRKVKDGRVDFSKRLSEDEYNSLIGMDIEEARKKLGNWWILENQSVNGASNDFYTFERAGFGRLTLYVDNTTNKTKNIVKRVDARVMPVSDSRKVKDGYSNNPNYFGDWYGEGQIDFDAIINPEDDGDLYMVKIWGGSGYVLDVYLVKAYDMYQAIDIVFDWSYENEGANNIIFDYEYLSKRCHEDYEDEYWYGKGNGKPSDTMTYEEFEAEWMGGYIPNSNFDLFAIDENFSVDVVPQDMIE